MNGFFAHVPWDSGMAYVVLQHFPANQPCLLPELLERHAAIPCQLARVGDLVTLDRVLVLAPGMRLAWTADQLCIGQDKDTFASLLPGDFLFQSAAGYLGEAAIGIVLSGTGTDGTAGLQAILDGGGRTYVQEPDTAMFEGMPRHAVEAGVASWSFPVEDMPGHILAELRNHPQIAQEEQASLLQRICGVLARKTDNDFSHYKPGTLQRRIHHRMQVVGTPSLQGYLAHLEQVPEEADALLNDLLIGVTEFFRDPQAFESLGSFLLPKGPSAKDDTGPLRVWVPGCCTGEEAYSIAILLREQLETLGSARKVRIFATDIDTAALLQAKAGRYTAEALRKVSPERRARFFTADGAGFRVVKELREMCVFSVQNLVRDPPFSSLHLIACRNVFIYMQPILQRRLVPLFHFALRPQGLLFLGAAEGLASHSELFEALDKTHRIFRRREVLARPPLEFPLGDRRQHLREHPQAGRTGGGRPTIFTRDGFFERMLLEEYAPASAIVNELGDILFCAGRIGRFLNPPLGAPSHNLLQSTSGPLRRKLRSLLTKVAKDDLAGPVHAAFRHDTGLGEESLRLTVRPMPGLERDSGSYAVIIQTLQAKEAADSAARPTETDSPLLDQMELELRGSQAELQSSLEELDSIREEFQTSNEELQTSNEELQASQEELQSMNEELTTINLELQEKISELRDANSDLQNLLVATDIATIFLDPELRITRFTPATREVYRLLDADLGRSLRDLVPFFKGSDILRLAAEVLASHATREAQVQALDGQRWFIARVLPYRTLAQVVSGVVLTFTDITEMMLAQRTLAESEGRYRRLFENMVNGYAHCEMKFDGDRPVDFRFLATNSAFETHSGLHGVAGQWVTEVIPGIRETDAALFERYGRVVRTNVPERFELFVETLGDWFDISVFSPRPGEFVAVFDKITERKDQEAAIRASEGRLRRTQAAAHAGSWEWDMATGKLIWSEEFFRLFGLDPALEASFEVWHQVIHPDDVAFTEARLQEAVRDHQPLWNEYRVLLPGGGIRWIQALGNTEQDPAGNAIRMSGICLDITARKESEQSLRQSEERLDYAMQHSHTGAWELDLEKRTAFRTLEHARIFGYDSIELPWSLDTFLGHVLPEDRDAVAACMREGIDSGSEWTFHCRIRRTDGAIRWIQVAGGVRSGAANQLGRVAGIVQDITAQKQAEAAVQLSEERFAKAFHASPDAIAITRLADGVYTLVNEGFSKFLGYTAEEVLGKSVKDLAVWVDPQDRERWRAELQTTGQVSLLELAFRRADGSQVIGQVSSRLITMAEEASQLSIIRDITQQKREEAERRLLEAEVEHMQRMESLGRLAGGMAHDMNNVLGAILAVTQSLRARPGAVTNLDESLATVERAATRGRDLVAGLVGFSRKGLGEPAPIDLNDLIRQEVALLDHTLLQKHRLVMDLAEPLPMIRGEVGAMGSALMNLCINAVDAMPTGGTITLRTRLAGAMVQVMVEDTGEGMAPEVLERAMEPFFTTKATGLGTGLGLAMVLNAVRAHGGTFTLQSELGQGTQALLQFPVTATLPKAEASVQPPAVALPPQHILFVDDDELLRATMPSMMELLGHRVEAVDSGAAALAWLASKGCPDLIVLDMNMPGLDGLETLRRIRALSATVPVLLATGYLEARVEAAIAKEPRVLTLTKPFTLDEIEEKLATLARLEG